MRSKVTDVRIDDVVDTRNGVSIDFVINRTVHHSRYRDVEHAVLVSTSWNGKLTAQYIRCVHTACDRQTQLVAAQRMDQRMLPAFVEACGHNYELGDDKLGMCDE